MPRKPRSFLPGVPAHIVQRGRSREPVFFEQGDYIAYLNWMGEAATRYDCAIHASQVSEFKSAHFAPLPEFHEGILGTQYLIMLSFWNGQISKSGTPRVSAPHHPAWKLAPGRIFCRWRL